jgi:phosphotransacetylase
MGAAKPVILTSRSDSAETKLASIALAALAS